MMMHQLATNDADTGVLSASNYNILKSGVIAVIMVVFSILLVVVSTFLLLKGQDDFETSVRVRNSTCASNSKCNSRVTLTTKFSP
jgi:hypothetical protein